VNKSQHMVAGSITSAATYILMTCIYDKKTLMKGIILSSSAGALVGILPDQLEPATSGNHRSFFHSISFALLAGYTIYQYFKRGNIENDVKIVLGVLSSAYASHLALDCFTQRRLPLIVSEF